MSVLVWLGINFFLRSETSSKFSIGAIAIPDDARISLGKDALRIFADYPLLGSGLDTFGEVYGRYASINTTLYKANYAHNEYLQQLSDCGILGFVALLALLFLIGKSLLESFKQRRSGLLKAVGGGALMGCLTFMIHSFFDFNFKIPANLMLFAFLLSLSYLALNTKREDSGVPTGLNVREIPFKSKVGIAYTGILLLLFTITAVFSVRATKSAGFVEAMKTKTKVLGEALKSNSYNVESGLVLARNLREKGKLDQAVRVLDRAASENPLNSYVDYELFRVNMLRGSTEEARKAIEKAIANDRMNAGWYKIAGDFYIGTAQDIKAVENYKIALELAPFFAERIFKNYLEYSGDVLLAKSIIPHANKSAAFELVKALVERERYIEALDIFREFVALEPRNESFYLVLTDMLLKKKQYGLVRKLISGKTFAKPQFKQNLGIALCSLGNVEEGISKLKEAFEANPSDTKSLDAIFRILVGTDLKLLKEVLDELAVKLRDNGHIHHVYSRYYARVGEWLRSVREAKIAISKDTMNPQYRVNLGNLYFERGLYVDAVEEWKRILAVNSNATWVRPLIAKAYEELGRDDMARKWRN